MPDADWWEKVVRDRPGGEAMPECGFGCTDTLFDARCTRHRGRLLTALGKVLQDEALEVKLGDSCPQCTLPVDGIETNLEAGTITYRHHTGGKGGGGYTCVAKGLRL